MSHKGREWGQREKEREERETGTEAQKAGGGRVALLSLHTSGASGDGSR